MVGLPIRFGVITLDGGERPNQYYIIERVQHENGSRAQTNQTLTKRAPLRVPFLILKSRSVSRRPPAQARLQAILAATNRLR